MSRVGIALLTKDRPDLSERVIESLLQPEKFDLTIFDGSDTEPGIEWAWKYHKGHSMMRVHHGIKGGADAAIVCALTLLLEQGYDYCGLVETDVLFTAADWFDRTMELFDLGRRDGLVVGAASARCYADRILVQRDRYALMHNLGAGMVILTREAARTILDHYRTNWTVENRSVFAILSGIDIGRYWAFKGNEHWLTADWGFDRILAQHGLASVALTPSCVEMIGQSPPLADQGLILVDQEIDEFRNQTAFDRFVDATEQVRDGTDSLPFGPRYREAQGEIVFAHQFGSLGAASVASSWRLHWSQGFGPFSWKAHDRDSFMSIPVFGPCNLLLHGGRDGGRFKIHDTYSGFEHEPRYAPGIMAAFYVPAGLTYRTITIEGLDRGVLVQGIQCVHPQPTDRVFDFDYHTLPKPG